MISLGSIPLTLPHLTMRNRYEDPRPMRTFANIRYALYGSPPRFLCSLLSRCLLFSAFSEYWLQYYSEQSYILILDFRDTFFQSSPFASLPPFGQRSGKYELMLFAENWKVSHESFSLFLPLTVPSLPPSLSV
jgi:hypothetical protein